MATLTITFDAPSPTPLSGYQVQYKTFSETEYTTVSPNPTSSPVVISGLLDETTYEGIIKSDCGNGLYGEEIPFVVTGDVVIPEFDYLVARYYWAPGAGTDLDTLTGIINSGISSIDNNWVGWSQGFSVPDGSVTADAYLISAGDNQTSGGAESILLNLKKFTDENPSVPNIINVNMYAFWWGSRNTGNALFELIAYSGGTMAKNGFEFENTGGLEVFRQTFTKNVTAVSKSSNPGTSTLLGTIRYNKTTKVAELVLQ